MLTGSPNRAPTGRRPSRPPSPRRRPTPDQDDDEIGPARRCLVTRASARRGAMLRFVLSPDRTVVPDIAVRLPGRGMWLSARADVIDTARRRGHFARSARGEVKVPDDLVERVVVALRRRIADHLSLARRAGQAVSGFERSREWLRRGRAALSVEASDGSHDERSRLLSGVDEAIVAWPLDGAALGTIFGRERVVHVAVARGGLAAGLLDETERLAGVSAMTMMKRIGG